MLESCQFCTLHRHNASAYYNKKLWETPNFFVIPALGMLVPGWVLILTKNHYKSFNSIKWDDQLRAEYEKLLNAVKVQIERNFSSPILFEHGSGNNANHTTACIEHAHLHLIPFDVTAADFTDCDLVSIRRHPLLDSGELMGEGYLYFETEAGRAHSVVPRHYRCQFIRRTIARKLNIPDEWDWMTNYRHGYIKDTIRKLS